MGFLGGDRPEQSYLLPPDVRDWLPAGHLAWALLGQAEEMDVSAFTGWYRADGQGRPAYHPMMMVALVCYCYCKGIRSSRAIEAATFDDLGARVICGNLHPDHSTTARFLERHQAAVKKLVAFSVTACAREGLVSVDVVAGDGTKIRASASKAANATVAELNKQIEGLEQLIEAEIAEWIAQARAEDIAQGSLPGDGDGGPPVTGGAGQGRRRTAATLARRRDARDRLAASEQARQAEADAAGTERTAKLEARAASAASAAGAMAAEADARAADYERRAGAEARRGPAPLRAQASAGVESVRNSVRGVVEHSVSAGHVGWPRPWGGQDVDARGWGGGSRGPGGRVLGGGAGAGRGRRERPGASGGGRGAAGGGAGGSGG